MSFTNLGSIDFLPFFNTLAYPTAGICPFLVNNDFSGINLEIGFTSIIAVLSFILIIFCPLILYFPFSCFGKDLINALLNDPIFLVAKSTSLGIGVFFFDNVLEARDPKITESVSFIAFPTAFASAFVNDFTSAKSTFLIDLILWGFIFSCALDPLMIALTDG